MKKLYLNTPFISLNEYINTERASKLGAATLKKSQTYKVAYLAKEQRFELPECKHDVTFIWYKPDNRKDHDNIAFAKKFILDGLVLSGVIKYDNPKYIGNFQDKFIVDKSRDYVSCVVIFEKSETK